MSTPTILAQLSDPHIRLDDDGLSADALSAAVETVLALETPADALIVTGDLVEKPGPASYELVQERLAPLAMPVHVLVGNHDDRDSVRGRYPVGDAEPGSPYRFVTTVGDMTLIGFDTTIPGAVEGAIDEEGTAWLAAQLATAPDVPTVIAMHHPPLETGNAAIDAIGLGNSDRTRLADLLAGNPQVGRVICGHVHTTALDTLAGCPIVACAGTRFQLPFAIPGGEDLELLAEPGAIALHVLVDGSFKTHVRSLS